MAVLGLTVAIAAASGVAASRAHAPSATSPPASSRAQATVSRLDVWERSIDYPTDGLANPWEDVRVTVTFVTPSKRRLTARGFYYEPGRYRIRFVPAEAGSYAYALVASGPAGKRSVTGRFTSLPSAARGFVRVSPTNPYRLVLADGSAFNGIGLNECIDDGNRNGRLDEMQIDGGFRPGGHDSDSGAKRVTIGRYLRAYGARGARFNLLRWNPGNCAFPIFDRISVGGNRYLEREGKLGDELVRAARANGFRVLFTFFTGPVYPDAAGRPGEAAALRRYLDYAIARYGPYVDLWELTNETIEPGADDQGIFARVSDSWLRLGVRHIRSRDPYRRLITNSLPRSTDRDFLDVRSPHWYQTESERDSDLATLAQVRRFRSRLPIIFGEQGNDGRNWDSLSGRRLRIRAWTAFFAESYLVFWNISFAKDCRCSGVYLGPRERGYVRSLQTFTDGLTGDLKPFSVEVGDPSVRAYGLRSADTVAIYLHRASDGGSRVRPDVTVSLPFAGVARWIDPATGDAIGSQRVLARGIQMIRAPSFAIDTALRVSRR